MSGAAATGWSDRTLEAGRMLGTHATLDAPLAEFCTYRVGGPAAALVRVDDAETLDLVAATVASTRVATLVVGRGSNLLVADRGFDGVAIVLGVAFADITIAATSVRAGAGALLPVVARATVRAGLSGFEWAVGVPGSIGGAVRMNAGGHGADMAASVVAVDVVDLSSGARLALANEALGFGYRTSSIADHHVVVAAELSLDEGDTDEGRARLAEIVRWRREHQPGGANAGSVFANPPGDSAGRLIDTAGLKGFRIGSASVSTKHANFIQVDPDGSADDVAAVMDAVARRVAEVHGVALVAENRLIGFERAVDA